MASKVGDQRPVKLCATRNRTRTRTCLQSVVSRPQQLSPRVSLTWQRAARTPRLTCTGQIRDRRTTLLLHADVSFVQLHGTQNGLDAAHVPDRQLVVVCETRAMSDNVSATQRLRTPAHLPHAPLTARFLSAPSPWYWTRPTPLWLRSAAITASTPCARAMRRLLSSASAFGHKARTG